MRTVFTLAIAWVLGIGVCWAGSVVLIDSDAGRVDGGAEVRCEMKVFGGKPLEIAWRLAPQAAARGPVPLKIRRVTVARRILLGSQEILPSDKGVPVDWKWDVPVTRGMVTYEITLETPKPVVVWVEAHDPVMFRDTVRSLDRSKLACGGLTAGEKAALSGWGLVFSARAGDEPQNGDAVLSVTREQGGEISLRTLVFSGQCTSAVVWAGSPTDSGFRARVPRHWLDPTVLAGDEGRIRLVSLLCETPPIP